MMVLCYLGKIKVAFYRLLRGAPWIISRLMKRSLPSLYLQMTNHPRGRPRVFRKWFVWWCEIQRQNVPVGKDQRRQACGRETAAGVGVVREVGEGGGDAPLERPRASGRPWEGDSHTVVVPELEVGDPPAPLRLLGVPPWCGCMVGWWWAGLVSIGISKV